MNLKIAQINQTKENSIVIKQGTPVYNLEFFCIDIVDYLLNASFQIHLKDILP